MKSYLGKSLTVDNIESLQNTVSLMMKMYMKMMKMYMNNGNNTEEYITYNSSTGEILNESYYTMTQKLYVQELTIQKVLEDKSIISNIEDKLRDYIQDNFDKYSIQGMGSYVCQHLTDKAYDITEKYLNELQEEYNFKDSEYDIADAIIQAIDFDDLYELVNDILNAPITFEEKLSDVGMSIHDFI